MDVQTIQAIERGVAFRQKLDEAAARLRRDSRHHYWLVDGGAHDGQNGPREIELYGVTSSIGCLDKSGPLTSWAARTQYEADEIAAYRLYQRGLPEGLTPEHFSVLFKQESEGAAVFKKERDAAADLGTQVHALVEHRVKEMLGVEAPEPAASDNALRLFAVWERWAQDSGLSPYAAEFGLYHPEERVGGTGDFLGEIDGSLALADWKTGKDIYAEAYLQSVAYRRLVVAMGLLDEMPVGYVVRLPKVAGDTLEVHRLGGGEVEQSRMNLASGRLEVVKREPIDEDRLWDVFRSLRNVYPWKREEDRRSYERWKEKRRR